MENVKKVVLEDEISLVYCLGELPFYWHDLRWHSEFFLSEARHKLEIHTQDLGA